MMNILDLLFSPAAAADAPPAAAPAGLSGGLSGGLGAGAPLPPPRPAGIGQPAGDLGMPLDASATPEAQQAGGRPGDVRSGVLATLPSAERAKKQQGASFQDRLAAGFGTKPAQGRTFWEAAGNGFGPSFSAALGADRKAQSAAVDQQYKQAQALRMLFGMEQALAKQEAGGGVSNRVARGNAEPRASSPTGGSQPRSYKPADPALVESRILRNVKEHRQKLGLTADDDAPASRKMAPELRKQREAELEAYERQQRARYPDLYPDGVKPPPAPDAPRIGRVYNPKTDQWERGPVPGSAPPQPTEARPADTPQPAQPAPPPTQPSQAPAAPQQQAPRQRFRYNPQTGELEPV